MDVAVLVAVTGAREASLVATVDACPGLRVVRRCADSTELLAAAQAGLGSVALVSADLRRLDRPALGRLRSAGVAVVGVVRADATTAAPGDDERLAALGVGVRLPAGAPAAQVAAAVAAALAPPDQHESAGEDAGGAVPDAPTGRVVAVWGTAGAPGRTTTAVTLASELATTGAAVLLVDADTWGASVAQALGLLDESAGVAAACRAAASGTLDAACLTRLAPVVLPGVRVLTGLPRPSRWPEVGGLALEAVLAAARSLVDWVVVDCAAPLEADEELSADTEAPRRNGAALAAVQAADTVLVVGAADPVGLTRLVRALGELGEAVPVAASRPVVTKVRASAVGSSPARRVGEVLERWAGRTDAVCVPDDRAGCDSALLAGRTLGEAVPSSPARAALRGLALELVAAAGGSGDATRRRGAPRRRRRRASASMAL